MKVLGVSGSPRRRGNTDILLQEALGGAGSEGAETELLTLRDHQIAPCDGCLSCVKTGKCHIDDAMQSIYPKLREADALVFGTPIYLFSMTGQFKVFLDRTLPLILPETQLANKVGGIVTVKMRTGSWHAVVVFQQFFQANRMFTADHWVEGLGGAREGIRKDQHAMKVAWELGRQVTLLAKQGHQFPRSATPVFTAL